MGTKMILLIIVASLSCVLGTPTLHSRGRIVGGEDIPIENVPYQISLESEGTHSCGGSIIAPNYIVTAAHCLAFDTEETLSVRAGTSTRESGGQVVKVKKIHIHPDYSSGEYDIGVLELADDLVFSDKVAPIGLPSPFQTWLNGTEMLVTGWGSMGFGTSAPVNLQGLTIEYFDRVTCATLYRGDELPETIFCAGVDGNTKSPCYGDSGGPLQADGVLVGVVNGGGACAEGIFPGYHANVPALLDFIEGVTGLE